MQGKCDDVGSDVDSAALRVSELATESEIVEERARMRYKRDFFYFVLLFQLKTGIGFTGSIGMRFSESRNGQWKPRSTTSPNN